MREVCPEPIYPEPRSFLANVDGALVDKLLHIVNREREPDMHYQAKLDGLGWRFKVTERVLGHHGRLIALLDRLSVGSPDKSSSHLDITNLVGVLPNSKFALNQSQGHVKLQLIEAH
ncbi:MAG: hypothetical protein MIO92_07300 [Methanosarcinaceae archaeon]|nr:hypothetical protein [Methanosarcinaceae archaeon]